MQILQSNLQLKTALIMCLLFFYRNNYAQIFCFRLVISSVFSRNLNICTMDPHHHVGHGQGHHVPGVYHHPRGGHHAYGHHGGVPNPTIPLYRTYWRMPAQPPLAARHHLTFNDRRHVGKLMSHYKAMICHLQGEVEHLGRDTHEKQEMMEYMACLLEQIKEREREQKLKDAQDQLA